MLLYNSIEETGRDQQQRILPSMNFSCSGNISKWTFVAWNRTGNQYPRFQLWRPDGTKRYRRVYESSIISTDELRVTATMSVQPGLLTVVGEYIPDNPVPFQVGYIFGLYQSEHAESRRLSVVHVDVPPGYGYDNYHGNNMIPEEFNTDGSRRANNYPLVAVETSKYQKTLSDKQRCQPLSKLSSRYRAADTARVHAYRCASSESLGYAPQRFFFQLNKLTSILRLCWGQNTRILGHGGKGD